MKFLFAGMNIDKAYLEVLSDDQLLDLHAKYLQVANVTEKFVQSLEDGQTQFHEDHPIQSVLKAMVDGAAAILDVPRAQANGHVNAIRAEMERRDALTM